MNYTVWVLSPELSHNYEKTNYVCYILYIMNSLTDTLLNDIEQYIDLLGTNTTDNHNKLEITSLKKNVKLLKKKLFKLRSKNNLLYKKIKNVDFDNDSSSKIKNLVQLRDSNIEKQSELISDINNLKKKCKYKPQKVVLNPLTKRFIKLDGKLAKKLIKDNIVKKCKTNYILNPRTNRCVSRKGKIGKKILKDMGLISSNKPIHIVNHTIILKDLYNRLKHIDDNLDSCLIKNKKLKNENNKYEKIIKKN